VFCGRPFLNARAVSGDQKRERTEIAQTPGGAEGNSLLGCPSPRTPAERARENGRDSFQSQ